MNKLLYELCVQYVYVFIRVCVFQCLGHTWYVDVDTQLFIFMPVVLLPLYFYPKKG